jgi:hypothetical protein
MATKKFIVEVYCPYNRPNVPFEGLTASLEEITKAFLDKSNPGEHFEVTVSEVVDPFV